LTENYTVYELDKHIGMSNFKLSSEAATYEHETYALYVSNNKRNF